MSENKHTITDLYQMQSLPLGAKVNMTKYRISQWIDEYGVDGVYVSFSGGKDSTVLLHIARELDPDIKAVFVDTGLEYPEIRQFVKSFDNVEWLKPKMTFRQVIEKYGYPFISKEVSECVEGAKRYLQSLKKDGVNLTGEDLLKYADETSLVEENRRGGYKYRYDKLCGKGEYTKNHHGKYNQTITENTPSKDRSPFNCERYQFFLEDGAPPISGQCCGIMKKGPAHAYQKKTGRNPIIATMASESRLRTQVWLRNGCNAFDSKRPTSNPMSFWTEQDVLLYIRENNIPICPIYGEIVEDYKAEGIVPGQMSLSDYGLFEKERPTLKTTGMERTGCMFCGFGCHLEKYPSRFEKMKVTHPKQYEYIMKPWNEGGLNYKEVIDWINEHGNLHIRY